MDLSTAEVIFGLEDSYTMDEVRAAYKRLAFEHHPDLNENSLESTNFMQQINEAYSILTQAVKRGSTETVNRSKKPQRDGDGDSNAQRSTDEKGGERCASDGDTAARAWQETAQRERRDRERQKAEQKKRQAATQAEARERQRREEKKEREYVSACETALKAKTLSEHREAVRLFKQLGCYKDAELYYAHHQTIVSEMQKRAGRVGAFTSFSIFLSSTSWLAFTAQTEGIFETILMAIFLGWWFPPVMGLVGTVAGLIDARAKADDGGGESELRWMMGLTGIWGSLLALGAIAFSANLLLTIISIGQLVGGVSCIINGSSKSGAVTKYIIASISYLMILAAGIHAFNLL